MSHLAQHLVHGSPQNWVGLRPPPLGLVDMCILTGCPVFKPPLCLVNAPPNDIILMRVKDREAWQATYSPQGRKEPDTTEQLNSTDTSNRAPLIYHMLCSEGWAHDQDSPSHVPPVQNFGGSMTQGDRGTQTHFGHAYIQSLESPGTEVLQGLDWSGSQ